MELNGLGSPSYSIVPHCCRERISCGKHDLFPINLSKILYPYPSLLHRFSSLIKLHCQIGSIGLQENFIPTGKKNKTVLGHNLPRVFHLSPKQGHSPLCTQRTLVLN